MNKKSIVFLLVLIFVVIFFSILLRKERKFSENLTIQLNLEKELNKVERHTYESLLINSILHNGICIDMPDSLHLTCPVFCVYVSQKQCYSCVKEFFKNYLDLFEIIPDSCIKILSDFNEITNRYLEAEFQIGYDFISVTTNGIYDGISGYPCFFVYNNKTKKSDLFFFPPKNEPKLVIKYLKEVRKRWYKND